MASLTWRAYLGVPGVAMPGLVEVSLSAGKTLRVDPYPVDRATLQFVSVSSWSISPKIGDLVYLDQAENTNATFAGFIQDVQFEYAIIAAEDRCTVTVEGVMSLLGRRELTAYTTTETRTINQAGQIADEVGIFWQSVAGGGRSSCITQTYTGNAFDLVNELIVTESGFMNEFYEIGDPDPTLFFTPRNRLSDPVLSGTTGPVIFSDAAGSSTYALYYDQITFKSAADNYYTQVTVEPQGLTTQVASKGAKPYRGLTINTLDSTTAQADDLAEYLVNMFASKVSYPTSLTVSFERQNTAQKIQVFEDMIKSGNYVAVRGQVVLRGTTYNVMIEGANIATSVFGTTQVTFFFTSEAMNNFLLLDDTVYGTLDTNRLGF